MAAASSRVTTVDSKYTTGNTITSHLPTTLLQKLVCPARYQQYLFTFLYDFFITKYNYDAGGGYELPRTTRRVLSPGAIDECREGGIPLDELREYVDETDGDVEYRLKQFPLCRYVAEQVSSYKIMSYERTLRTIMVILEINIDVLYRQCHLFLCTDGRTRQLYTSPSTSLWLSNRDVGRIFVEAWRDYTMQCYYGKSYPKQLRMSLVSPSAYEEFNIVDYYRQHLNIDCIVSDDMILDFYAFESEDVKKGTNGSRLINTLRQLEIGDHVYPGYVSVFRVMYTSYIEEPLKFLKLQYEYNTLVVTASSTVTPGTAMMTTMTTTVSHEGITRRRGRKRKNPTKIIDDYGHQQLRRQLWYDRQYTKQIQQDDLDVMLDSILETLKSPAPIPQVQQQQQYGKYVKDISSCIVPSSPPHVATTTADESTAAAAPPDPTPRRRRKSRSYYKKVSDYRHSLMMSNVIL